MFEVKKDSVIYIACFSQHATGGTELLHQLCYKLSNMGLLSQMYYFDYIEKGLKGSPIPEKFSIYNVNYSIKINDEFSNLLIMPETALFLINQYAKVQKIIWWLSVDFYKNASLFNTRYYFFRQSIKVLLNFNVKGFYRYMIKKWVNPFTFKNAKCINHFVQSEYALQYLLSNGVDVDNIFKLSDYLNERFFINNKFEKSKKINRVLYNPAKGVAITQKIMEKSIDIEFIALKGFSTTELLELMRTSKVYIDFGNHPGKDRIPREAAISGMIVITNKSGSAAYQEDVPIDLEYKFIEENDFELRVNKLIKDIFMNYESHYFRFDTYRKMISNEEEQFNVQLINLFQVKN